MKKNLTTLVLCSLAMVATSFAAEPPSRVACIGDSITEGAGADPGKSYPSQLQELLGTGWKVGNYGVSGRTLLDKGDFPYTKENAYQDALQFLPNVVIIMLGTNDTKPQNWRYDHEFVADYTKLVAAFRALESKPQIYLCRPCPVVGDGSFDITEKNLQKVIQKVDALAKDLKTGVIDMYAALEGKPELIPDKVHPNTQGALEMSKAAAAVLTAQPPPSVSPAAHPADPR